jgi:hypothetical protein
VNLHGLVTREPHVNSWEKTLIIERFDATDLNGKNKLMKLISEAEAKAKAEAEAKAVNSWQSTIIYGQMRFFADSTPGRPDAGMYKYALSAYFAIIR